MFKAHLQQNTASFLCTTLCVFTSHPLLSHPRSCAIFPPTPRLGSPCPRPPFFTVTCQPTSDRVTAIAPVALPAANQFPPYLPYTHRNFFFHGTIIPPEANHTYLGNAFEHCLLNASRAPGDYLEQRSAEECGAFCGVAAGDCQPLCSGHGMCSFSESVQESTTAVSLAGAAAQPFNGTIILTPPTSNTSGAAQCSAHLPLPFD
ncbi:unnamed protein product [Closterium sp. NIES-64]|nr:unnamed protein product [Closterium sp. NIES-65]CAI5948001.1 unnamed protein product [Closterium sp. NIES-64]CAI5957258.1 unnamed protein product [Closterium sp. NIES-64]CAI6007642.1 unnamed protein product [Closterium sp. NIES-65]